MDILEFTDIFLPRLVADYVNGKLPLHALIDIDLWKRVFPDKIKTKPGQILWYQIKLTCNPLSDGTRLLTFVLPMPCNQGEPKFAAIRLSPQNEGEHRAIYYTLRKPGSILEHWDVHELVITPDTDNLTSTYKCTLDDTDSLRNFVICVQQFPFVENKEEGGIFNFVKQFFGDVFSEQ